MRTLIEGGWVVAWNGREPRGARAGERGVRGRPHRARRARPTRGRPTRASPRAGKLVSPGFINTHVHTAGNGGDYLLLDMAKNDYRTANYMAFAAPLKGKMTPPPAEATAAAPRLRLPARAQERHHHRSSTWAACAATGTATPGWWTTSGCASTAARRSATATPTWTRRAGSPTRRTPRSGRARLQEAVGLRAKFDRTAQGRLRVLFNAAQVETCSEPLLRAGKDAARELERADPHPRGRQPRRVPADHGRVPQDARSASWPTSASSTSAPCSATWSSPPRTTWARYPFGDDLRLLAERGATVGHCPYKYAKMAMTLHSFQRYLDAGRHAGARHRHLPARHRVRAALGVHPGQGHRRQLPGRAQHRDVFNAATHRRLPVPRAARTSAAWPPEPRPTSC